MDFSSSKRRVLAGTAAAALFVLLSLTLAVPAFAAPRSGINVARRALLTAPGAQSSGLLNVQLNTGGGAVVAAPAPTGIATIPFGVAAVIGAVGAVVLLAAARSYGVAQRRGRGGRLATLTGRGIDRDRRKAA